MMMKSPLSSLLKELHLTKSMVQNLLATAVLVEPEHVKERIAFAHAWAYWRGGKEGFELDGGSHWREALALNCTKIV